MTDAKSLVGKRVRMHDGYATVVSIRADDPSLVVLRYDDYDGSVSVAKVTAVEKLPDERGTKR